MNLITVCAQGRPVTLDSGRTLDPGEFALVAESPRMRQIIEDRNLTLVIEED